MYIANLGTAVESYKNVTGEIMMIEGLHPEVKNLVSDSKTAVIKNSNKYISGILSLQLEIKSTTDEIMSVFNYKQKVYLESEKVCSCYHYGFYVIKSRTIE